MNRKLQISVVLQALHCLREDCPEYSLAYSSPNDYFVDPAAEELVKLFTESQIWELDWDLHDGDEIRFHISQAVNAKCIFIDTGKFKPLFKTVQTGVNVTVKCMPFIIRSVVVKLELFNYPGDKLPLDEYIQIDAFLTYWNDDMISPGSIEFSNSYETDMKNFRQGGRKEIKKLWNDQSPRFIKDSEFVEIVRNDKEKFLFEKHNTTFQNYEKCLFHFEDQIQFSVKSNLKNGHCHLNLMGGLLILKKEMEQYEVIVTCRKVKRKHETKKCEKIKRYADTSQKDLEVLKK